jgi:hypothetical protein
MTHTVRDFSKEGFHLFENIKTHECDALIAQNHDTGSTFATTGTIK